MYDAATTGPGTEEGRFQGTPWTMILAARRAARLAAQSKQKGQTNYMMVVQNMAHELAQNLVQNLAQAYWKPVFCFLYRSGKSVSDAEDLTQGFFCQKLLEGNLAGGARPQRGRFRSFLLAALKNYVNDAYKSPKDPLKHGFVAIEFENADRILPSDEITPEQAFHQQLVRDLVDTVLFEVHRELHEEKKEAHWDAFCALRLDPIMEGAKKTGRDDLCKKHGIKDQQTISNMVVTVERRFRMRLVTRLRDWIRSDSDLVGEYQEILESLTGTSQA